MAHAWNTGRDFDLVEKEIFEYASPQYLKGWSARPHGIRPRLPFRWKETEKSSCLPCRRVRFTRPSLRVGMARRLRKFRSRDVETD